MQLEGDYNYGSLELAIYSDTGQLIEKAEIVVEEEVYYTNENGQVIIFMDESKDVIVKAEKAGYVSNLKFFEAPIELKFGDIRGDNNITVQDAIYILRYLVGLYDFDNRQRNVADLNGDGSVTVADAILILRFIVGLIDVFPVEEN